MISSSPLLQILQYTSRQWNHHIQSYSRVKSFYFHYWDVHHDKEHILILYEIPREVRPEIQIRSVNASLLTYVSIMKNASSGYNVTDAAAFQNNVKWILIHKTQFAWNCFSNQTAFQCLGPFCTFYITPRWWSRRILLVVRIFDHDIRENVILCDFIYNMMRYMVLCKLT